MPSPLYQQTIQDVYGRRGKSRHLQPEVREPPGAGAGVYEFQAPGFSSSAPSRPARVPEPRLPPEPAMPEEREFAAPRQSPWRTMLLSLATSPERAQAIMDRDVERLMAVHERTQARARREYDARVKAWERQIGQAQKEHQRVEDSLTSFGRQSYRRSGDPGDLYEGDPAREHMPLRAATPGPEPGETWKSPEGEDWYVGPTGKWVRGREGEDIGDYRLSGDDARVESDLNRVRRQRLEIDAKIQASKAALEPPRAEGESDEQYEARRKAEMKKLPPEVMVQYQELLSTAGVRVDALNREEKILTGRLNEIRRRRGGVQRGNAPRPKLGETRQQYHNRLTTSGLSDDEADDAVLDAEAELSE